MKLFNSRFLAAFFLFAAAFSSHAQSSDASASNTGSAVVTADNDQPGWFRKEFNSAESTVENLYDNGRLSMVLSGYAHHGRGTYTPERIDQLNEKVWGLGMSKELRDDKGNEEELTLVIMADSHYSPQITAGYGYQWMAGLGNNWEAGIGYTAGLISRADIIGGVPFPGILPLASIGTRDTKLMVSYIPRLSGNKGNGDVMFFALRVNLK